MRKIKNESYALIKRRIEMLEDKILKETLSHLLNELNIPNVAISLQRGDFEKIQKAHASIHEFARIPLLLINSDKDFQAKSAFLVYQWETFDQAHRSILETLSGYYNTAYVLLRNTLELILKAAFWECMAHKKYRSNAGIIKKRRIRIENHKISLIDWLNKITKQKPSIDMELEKTSMGIYDKIFPLFENETFKKIIPDVKSIVSQLTEWEIFDPIQEIVDPVEYVYDGFYKKLSADVHVEPDKLTIGRRLLVGEELFETKILLNELNKYAETLHRVMDLGIVVELNILGNLVNEESREQLEEELEAILELGLNFATTKIVKILEK